MTLTSTRLSHLLTTQQQHLLRGGLKGLEKESLRLNQSGLISQTQHPYALGSALTHSDITTDYSEALIELITPPFVDVKDTLAYLHRLHQFVYAQLDDEILLGSSMPCGIDGDDSIRIAEYGTSNVGRMKHIYRHGLWHRYGRTMQAIAGIHFNYSVPEALWSALHEAEHSDMDLAEFTNASYFALIRNFQRIGWLILYLFGASPAICKQFFKSRPSLMSQFVQFDHGTLYHPYATSLRMSDIGYKSKNQANLNIDYNSLTGYVDSLSKAINTPFPDYEQIGVLVNGEYRQLNSNILQIENEFYSIIRPKQVAKSCEKPTIALQRRGVRYIEMRSLDLDVFNPIGVREDTLRFIEALLLTCLLTDSPKMSDADHKVNNANQLAVANNGRKSDLELNRNGHKITLQRWATDILEAMQPVCQILDEGENEQPYMTAWQQQRDVVGNPELTASARMLAAMQEQQHTFARFALNTSEKHANYFLTQPLDPATTEQFITAAKASHAKQHELEAKTQLPFAEFLERYFTQTCREQSND